MGAISVDGECIAVRGPNWAPLSVPTTTLTSRHERQSSASREEETVSDVRAERSIVATDGAPAAIGPYSQAIVANGLLYTAGQLPLDPETMTLVEGDISAQTERVMLNLGAVLAAAGSGFDRVVKTTCFLADLNDFAAFNAVYGQFLGSAPPPRSTVQVAKLPLGALVEVECIALTP
ncbi:MAG: RidA family protein [Chloroflexia bacterium]|nr:RidA family protein [Chloroflexia bacterium]